MGPFGERRRWRGEDLKRRRDRRETKSTQPAFALIKALVVLLFGALIVQLVHLQVIRGDEYARQAEINALRELPIPSARGLIYDRELRPLVQNSARFSATIVPGDLPERGETAVYRLLAAALGTPAAEIQAKVETSIDKEGEYTPVVIKQDIKEDTALVLMELEPHAPGLKVLVEPARRYLPGPALAHVLGYVGAISPDEYKQLKEDGYRLQDVIGKSGVELTYESLLRGRPGKKLVKVDAAGRELEVISERLPVDGANVVLTIDLEMQKQVEKILEQYVGPQDNGAAVVMDVHTGEVLAMVSVPSFDNNIFSGPLSERDLAALVDSPAKPLVNHAIAERYPPGSTFKTIVGAAALQEGIATPSTTITSRGYILVENEYDPNVVYPFKDWAALGPLDFYGGIAMSSDVYFYYLSGGKADEGFRGLGEERVARYARAFGLGEPTGIDLPGESPGLVPDAEWKRETLNEAWFVGDTYNFGIGQGYLSVTPLQMASAISAVANGGQLLTPHLLKETRDSHGNVLQKIEVKARRKVPVDPGYLQIVTDAMLQSVTRGVAKPAAVKGLEIAGKTGTAEFGAPRFDGSHETHGWFVGFAPYDDPQIAVAVFVQRGGGGQEAAPAAAQIFDYYFHGPKLAAKPVLSEVEGPEEGG